MYVKLHCAAIFLAASVLCASDTPPSKPELAGRALLKWFMHASTTRAFEKQPVRSSIEGWCLLLQELIRLQKLVQLPAIQEALKEKFSRFDADLNPTHDHDGRELDAKVTAACCPFMQCLAAECPAAFGPCKLLHRIAAHTPAGYWA